MALADLLKESVDVDRQEVWANERTPTPVRASGCASIRWDCPFEKSSQCLNYLVLTALTAPSGTGHIRSQTPKATHRRLGRRRVAVDETQITVDGEKKWLYAAIDTDAKLLLEINVFSRRGIGPAAAFLTRLSEKHDIDDSEFLIDAGGYLTALARRQLSGQLNYSEQNHVEKWFQTVSMRIDRFHSFW